MGMKRLVLVSLCVACATGVFSQSVEYERDFPFTSARIEGLGGKHVALADDFSVIFSNPAGFHLAEPELSLADLHLGIHGPAFTIAGIALEAAGGGGDIFTALLGDPAFQDLLKSIYAGIDLNGPLAFGYVGEGIGFGLFNSTEFLLESKNSTTLGVRASESLLLTGGYTQRIPLPESSRSTLDMGIALKGGLRFEVEDDIDLLSLILSGDFGALMDFMGYPFRFVGLLGLDVGVLYGFNEWLYAGITFNDAYTPSLRNDYASLNAFLGGDPATQTADGLIPFSMDVGVALYPPLFFLQTVVTDLGIYLDYRDSLGLWLSPRTAKNPILNIGLGLELTLLQILTVQGGFNDGLFSAGFGVDLDVMELQFAMYGSETSTEPGLRPLFNMMLSLAFRI
jgi:hypothetical protein